MSGSCDGLAAADPDFEGSGRDAAIAIFIHDAEIAGAQREADCFFLAAIEMHAAKSCERADGRSGEVGVSHVDLHDFVAGNAARVLHFRAYR